MSWSVLILDFVISFSANQMVALTLPSQVDGLVFPIGGETDELLDSTPVRDSNVCDDGPESHQLGEED